LTPQSNEGNAFGNRLLYGGKTGFDFSDKPVKSVMEISFRQPVS
jgi:hypothetical protein